MSPPLHPRLQCRWVIYCHWGSQLESSCPAFIVHELESLCVGTVQELWPWRGCSGKAWCLPLTSDAQSVRLCRGSHKVLNVLHQSCRASPATS